ncbi:MAG: GFA family protein [Gammaproteobacteria bacterium]|nr:GFA family protein [Gammaproteobacteria bacterium]NVK89269.1 GFA family protein [Gammaproteobacteria bacterium]
MKGSCLCQTVTYQITPPFKIFQYCHCSRCRKFTGSAFAPNLFVPPEQFTWLTGEAAVQRYEAPDAKYFATQFCSHCGSSLPWLVQGGSNVVVPVGTLDDPLDMQPQGNIFWQSKAPWYVDACELVQHDTVPPRAKRS